MAVIILTNWLASQSAKPVAFPNFDSQVAFDNNQVVLANTNR